MFSNYLKVFLRQVLKNKVFSAINILGLSIGVACCALLALFVQDEFSYEKQFPDRQQIFRIYSIIIKDGATFAFPRTSPPIAMDLAAILPEVETATRSVNNNVQVRYKDKLFYEHNAGLVDSTFFRIFPYEFKEGDSRTALDAPSTVVLSENVASKIFGDKSPIDELLTISTGQRVETFRVTGVLRKSKYPSHLDAPFYMAMHSRGWGKYVTDQTTWAWNNFVAGYLKLKPGSNISSVERKMNEALQQHAGADLKSVGIQKSLHLQPLDDIRLYSDFTDAFGDMGHGTITYIYILGAVGGFILLIACINFMNLTTARATQRAGEVGVRKAMGAHRSTLIRQFLGESFSIVLAALLLSLLFLWMLLPVINHITQKSLSINTSNIVYLGVAMIFIGACTGLLAGSYPAFILSSFEAARVLKNKSNSGNSSSLLRQALVVFQFVIAITLISSIIIIQQQINFIQSKPLGFNQDNVILMPMRSADASRQFLNLKNEFSKISGVDGISGASSLPSTPLSSDNALYNEGSSMEKAVLHRIVSVDENYFKVLGIPVLAGREFRAETDTFSYKATHTRIIVNEASLNVFNIPLEKAIGAKLHRDDDNRVLSMEIVGVVSDFHQMSLHLPIFPMVFVLPADRTQYAYIVAAADGKNVNTTITQLQSAWQKIVPDVPFEKELLEDSVKKQYESDDRISIMLTGSTILAIVISCLGLYGLSIFVAERKIKEIGIRKVLGASVTSVVTMLSKEFIVLVLIALIIAVPIGVYLMNEWLATFAYKIKPGFLVFVISGTLSILIALITIGFESIKAAMGNPVDALRSE